MLTKEEFLSKLQEARELTVIRQGLIDDIFGDYDFEDVTFKALDASNLDEAIQCYVNYGELPVSGNLEDFWEAYNKAVSSLEEG